MSRYDIEELRKRAENRCEYCHLPAAGYRLPFQVDHIFARRHGGTDDPGNLALSCYHRNRHKGPNIAGRDTVSQEVTRLFHPRTEVWGDHFQFEAAVVVGLTDIGRVTIDVLAMNDPQFVLVRRMLLDEGVWSFG